MSDLPELLKGKDRYEGNCEVLDDHVVCTCCMRGRYAKEKYLESKEWPWAKGSYDDKWPPHLQWNNEEGNKTGCHLCGGFGWIGFSTEIEGEKYWLGNNTMGMTVYEGKEITTLCNRRMTYSFSPRGMMPKELYDEINK